MRQAVAAGFEGESRHVTSAGDGALCGSRRLALINGDPQQRPEAPPGANDARHQRAEAEFEEFFRNHHRELARLAYTMTGSQADADDIVGEGLASVWEHWDRVQAADHPRAYVRRIVINLAANRVKQVVRQRQAVGLMGPIVRWFHHGPDVGAAVDLQAAVLTLPPRRRACVLLRHVLDLPEDEVARTLGISVGTVKSQTSKGLAQLRLVLGNNPMADDGPDERQGGKHGDVG
jgi:RNA polymerase sigma-70 factor (sigma-E family)